MSGSGGERFRERLVIVGSTNPTKVEAVRRVCAQAWPGCRVEGVEVPSGVPAQPIGEKQTLAGARQRARGALARHPGAWMGIGLEGGVDRAGHLLAVCCAVDERGRENAAWGLRMPLPAHVASAVLAGEELGPLLERLSGRAGIGRGEGAVGLFTAGLIDRTRLWETAVAGALAPWLAPEWYRPGEGG